MERTPRMANHIWLSSTVYGDYQSCRQHIHDGGKPFEVSGLKDNFAVAEFIKTYSFDKKAESLKIKVSADIMYYLHINGKLIGIGPAAAGGDFLIGAHILPHNADIYTVDIGSDTVDFHVFVRYSPSVLIDYSKGRGGLLIDGSVIFDDGSEAAVGTDESWLSRVDRRRLTIDSTDMSVENDGFIPAVFTEDIWHERTSPLPPLTYERVYPVGNRSMTLKPGETRTESFEFDRIYGAYVTATISGAAKVTVGACESPEHKIKYENVITNGKTDFMSLRYYSTAMYIVTAENLSNTEITVTPSALAVCYPVTDEGSFECSDDGLNAVYDVCKWTLRICRQSLHLDSTSHQEFLACTGDYYIESMMTAFTYGDMRLAAFDVMRTADNLTSNGGRMFHTTYSLIWVLMLREVYKFTADTELLTYCLPALRALLDRFEGYLGDNYLVEKAPDYMFVDWSDIDGYNMHHPPKCLGQSVLTAYLCGALEAAQYIFCELGDSPESEKCKSLYERIKVAFNELLWDDECGLYFEGLGTPDEEFPNRDMRFFYGNVDKRYFTCYSNILACLFGICEGERAKAVMNKVAGDRTLPDIQPYFMHWELEALWLTGLYERYGMEKLNRWKALANECNKGLKEGWFAPATYTFDHSHAWGGTPAYQLPARLLGFDMVEPGFKKIKLSPSLLGLKWANIEMPTPYGHIICHMEEGRAPEITVPDGIEYELVAK